MRIVKSLDNITQCPNCTGQSLILTKNDFGRPFKQCCICTEEIYEDEDTRYNLDVDENHTFNVGKAPNDIDDSLMNLEYEIGDITHYATTKDELATLEHIQNIFYDLISVIRRMK